VPSADELAGVPAVAEDAEVDPHWLDLVGGGVSALPRSYVPAAMSGPTARWRRTAAWTLIVMLVSATAGGICLTYGPDELFRLVGR